MHTLYLIRHGHTNTLDTYDSTSSEPLNPQGKQVARKVSQWLAKQKIQALYTSPVTRCIQTAAILSQACSLPYTQMSNLREIDFGDFKGKTSQEILAVHPTFLEELANATLDYQFPHGESGTEFYRRVQTAITDVVSTSYTASAVVTHKGVIQALLAIILKSKPVLLPFALEPASVTMLEYYDSQTILIKGLLPPDTIPITTSK